MKDWREKPSRVSHPVLTGVHGQDENGEEIVIDSTGSLAGLAEKKKGRRRPEVVNARRQRARRRDALLESKAACPRWKSLLAESTCTVSSVRLSANDQKTGLE